MSHGTESGGASVLPPEVRRGLELFNEGHFHEAHEEIEEAWKTYPKGHPTRVFFQGLIQAAVAMHHHRRGKQGPAVTMIARARTKLVAAPATHFGIDVARLLRDLDRCEELFLDPEQTNVDYPSISYE